MIDSVCDDGDFSVSCSRLATAIGLSMLGALQDEVFESDTRWTVVRGSDLEEGESQGLPVWSRHVGDPILASNQISAAPALVEHGQFADDLPREVSGDVFHLRGFVHAGIDAFERLAPILLVFGLVDLVESSVFETLFTQVVDEFGNLTNNRIDDIQ